MSCLPARLAFKTNISIADADRAQAQYLTIVLLAFKRNQGLKVMKDVCDIFIREVKALTPPESVPESEKDVSARLTSAYGGIRIILNLFSELAFGKNITESAQTHPMTSDRDRGRPDYFQAGQFTVDLRMEILPMVRELWNSDFATQSSSSIIKCMVDILRSCLDGEFEAGAARRSGSPPAASESARKTFVINMERLASLQEKGFDKDLTKEALYRCANVATAAEEYCKAFNWLRAPPRFPPPSNDIGSVASGTTPGGEAPEDPASGEALPFNLEHSALSVLLSQASGRDYSQAQEQVQGRNADNDGGNGTEFLARALNHILHHEQNGGDGDREGSSSNNPGSSNPPGDSSSSEPSNQPQSQQPEQPTGPPARRHLCTIEDLDSEREKIRSNMIERCLDILNEHYDVSFELSDLIASAIRKHREPENFRREVGETLVQSLVSLQMENFETAGKKIAAYAHLLALVLQDRDMYNATTEELKDGFETFLSFVKLPTPEKPTDESFPWIGHVLLILEKLLSDDCQPQQIRWTPPSLDDPNPDDHQPAQLEEPLVSHDNKVQLFESLVEILPRIGKDDALALSICRILVILTRNRSIATRLGEKRSLQRLFVMVKQLSSATNEKLQGTFMLILRHIIEDEESIRQIMRSEVVAALESKRQMDTTGYVRQMYHLVLRSPEIFVEVSNEKLKLHRYDVNQRPQILVLKPEKTSGSPESSSTQEGGSQKPSTEESSAENKNKDQNKDKDKGKGAELKPPTVENPDGVIHYLLSELLSYKEVDDKESPAESLEPSRQDQPGPRSDVEMSTEDQTPSAGDDAEGAPNSKKTEKPAFKADEHPIYIYRCFLLQCLTELLSSYNRTKVEFINFSRKADPHATTPSKPRSGILNYLLNALVPIGTMEHEESVIFKKRTNTSAWTMRVLVALCTKTGEFGGTGRRRNDQLLEEDEPELTFVRRFVLEHALRSYKDASASSEPLDSKYSKLMSLTDLFDKMLSGYTFVSGDSAYPSSTKQLAKTMFEKNFIPALTASIADIDLNFPASKRVIKYILRPLNKLTQTAVYLSETSNISTQGETEEDEISSATSVSDIDEDREETPDLFRHSTLGMLEPRQEEETSSEGSEDEDEDEMYDDEYEEEMDYDEEIPQDDGEMVSEDEDEVEGVGPIEGLPGDSGMDIEVVVDDDEDGEDDEGNENHGDVSDMDDDENFAGEITGDRDNESLEGGDDDDDEWESEEISENDEEAEMMDQFEDELADIGQPGQQGEGHRFNDLFRVLNEAAGGMDDLQEDSLGGGEMHDDMADDDLNEDEGWFFSFLYLF